MQQFLHLQFAVKKSSWSNSLDNNTGVRSTGRNCGEITRGDRKQLPLPYLFKQVETTQKADIFVSPVPPYSTCFNFPGRLNIPSRPTQFRYRYGRMTSPVNDLQTFECGTFLPAAFAGVRTPR
jgi:hypothetical protein